MHARTIGILLVAAVGGCAQDDIQSLRAGFRGGRYREILQPLAMYCDRLQGTGPVADEADYMLATTMCAIREWTADGCNYAKQMNSSAKVGGRTIREQFASCCRSAGLDPPCVAGSITRGDSACATSTARFDTRSRTEIRAAVLGREIGREPPREDLFEVKYWLDSNGWQGTVRNLTPERLSCVEIRFVEGRNIRTARAGPIGPGEDQSFEIAGINEDISRRQDAIVFQKTLPSCVQDFSRDESFNIPDGDYRDFPLSRPLVELCAEACANELRCKSYTYVRPGIQGNLAHCWLKEFIRGEVRDNCCTSGIKDVQNQLRR